MVDERCEEKLNELIVSYARVCVEVTGIKEVLDKQPTNQAELIRLVERQEAMLEIVKKNQKENDELFKSVRKLENVRADERLILVEQNQRRFVYTSLGLIVAIITSVVIKTISL